MKRPTWLISLLEKGAVAHSAADRRIVDELLTLGIIGLKSTVEGRLKGYDGGGMTRLALRDGKDIKKRTKELMNSLIKPVLTNPVFI